MQELHLNGSTKAFLTNSAPDPTDGKKVLTFQCDLKGKPLAPGTAPIPVYRDMYSGDVYARVAEVLPTSPDATSVAAAQAILALKPVSYCSEDGSIKGFFVRVAAFDDFNEPA
jgi:hypothetical protein